LTDNADEAGWVDLADAIEGLRAGLEEAWLAGKGRPVRFRLEPVELTVQAVVTRTRTGSAGVRWHVLTAGGERSRQTASTQTLVLRLSPVIVGPGGEPLSADEQLVSDVDDDAGADAGEDWG
jgi:Trypsin-co-occurring domain 2